MNPDPGALPDVYTKRSLWARAWQRLVKNNPKAYLFFSFLLPASLMFVIYAVMGTFPFGRSSVLVLDLNGQYVYFFEALRDFVYGEGSLLYSFGRALGGEFMGIYAYYLASPLSYIVCLFPKHAILEALYTMFVLKCGLCGLTFGYYLHCSAKVKSKAATVMFSTMYALCAYCVVYQHNTMWIDCVFLLPLVALGIERLIAERKYALFTISFALAVLSNFYIGYMMCFFVAIYSVYAYFSRTPEENNPLGERWHFFRSVLRVALFSAIALAISMIITMPAVYALSFGKNTFQNPTFPPNQRFDFLDLLSKFFIGSYDTVRPEGLPVVYSGILALFCLPLYFISRKRSSRERVGTAILIVFFILCFNFNPVDMAWHGFQLPNWLNYRYSFMLCFVILVAGRKAYEEMGEYAPKIFLGIAAFLALAVAVMQKLDLKNMPDFAAVWLSLAFIAVYCIGLSFANRSAAKETCAAVMCVLVSLEMFSAGLLNLVDLDEDVVISSYDSYHDFIDKIQPIVDEVKDADPSFYRMEKNEHRKVNDPLALGFRGLSNSTSTLNASTILFLQQMGYSSKSHWSKYLGGTPVSDTLLGLKYLIAKQDDKTVDELWGSPYLTDEENGYVAYRNAYALSLAYAVNSKLTEVYLNDPNKDLDEDDEDRIAYKELRNPFDRMNKIITAMLGSETEIQVFKKLPEPSISYDNLNVTFASLHKKYAPINSKAGATLELGTSAVGDGVVYCYFPSSYPREVDLTLNGQSYGTYYGNETCRIVDLGSFSDGDAINIKMKLKKDDLYILSGQTYFWYIDDEVFREAMTALGQSCYQIEEYTETHFKGTITAGEDQTTVFTSIPYDEGWNVYLDGKRVEVYETLDALLAFDITPGTHTLELRYLSRAIFWGRVFTAIGLTAFILILVFDKKLRRLLSRLYPADAPKTPEDPASPPSAELPPLPEGPEVIPDDFVTAPTPPFGEKATTKDPQEPGSDAP